MGFINKYIGDKDFYSRVFRVAFPIALSELLIHCSEMIDSIMVSSINMVTAVGNAYNIVNLFHYIMYGIEAGVALFAAQFFGAKQYDNMSKSQGLNIVLTSINTAFWILVVFLIGDKVLLFYLNDYTILPYSLRYIRLACWSFIPISLNRTIKCQYQAMHRTRVTFVESLAYVITSILFKYVCIFIFDLGIEGLAIGSILSECICFIGILIYMYIDKPVFLQGFKKMFSFDWHYIKAVIEKILPCAFNEVLFGFGQTLFNKAYGMVGSASMEAVYISGNVLSMIQFAVWGYGDAVSILVGTQLGRNKIEEAKVESKYHLGLSFVLGMTLCFIMIFAGPLILKLYSISDNDVYKCCLSLLAVYGLKAFLRTFTYVMFCTLKAGGDSKMFNLLDSGITYSIGLPIAFGSVLLGVNDVIIVVLLCQIEQIIRFFLTLKRYNSYKWANNLTKMVG